MAGDVIGVSTSDASMGPRDLLIHAFMHKDTTRRYVRQVQNLAPKLLRPRVNSLTSWILSFLTCQVVLLTTLPVWPQVEV